MTSGIRPVGKQVLVLPDPVEQVSESGIQLMSDKELDRLELGQTEGEVIALGKAVGDVEYKVGDRVIFAKYVGLLLDGADGKRYRLVQSDTDIKGVFENGDKE